MISCFFLLFILENHYIVVMFIVRASIWACCNVCHHILVLEEKNAIFSTLLKPLISAPQMVPSMQPASAIALGDLDGGVVAVARIVKKSCFSK